MSRNTVFSIAPPFTLLVTFLMLMAMPVHAQSYDAPWWLPGGHLQTIYSTLFTAVPQVSYKRERWETPDGDFIDVDWLIAVEEQVPAAESNQSQYYPPRNRPVASDLVHHCNPGNLPQCRASPCVLIHP